MSAPKWRIRDLPDGRRVEYVDAVRVTQDGDDLLCDVTVMIDGALMGPTRVRVPLSPGGDAMSVSLILPDPGCSFGYPLGQVRKLLGNDRLGAFWVWMVGRKLRHCFGTKHSPAHGPVVYPVDLARFLEEAAA